jgi:hypothetical protein
MGNFHVADWGIFTTLDMGQRTWGRKHVDWEIRSTLHYEHALLAVLLPTMGLAAYPDRLWDNLISGYADQIHWTNDAATLRAAIERANLRSRDKSLIRNWRLKLDRDLA